MTNEKFVCNDGILGYLTS